MLLLFFILAAAAPLSPAVQNAIYTLGGIVLGVGTFWTIVRRRPSLDTELARFQSAIEGLQRTVDLLAETNRGHANHGSEIKLLKSEIRTLRAQRETDAQTQRSYVAKTSRDIFMRIEAVEKSVSDNFQSVERALGRIEGKLEASSK